MARTHHLRLLSFINPPRGHVRQTAAIGAILSPLVENHVPSFACPNNLEQNVAAKNSVLACRMKKSIEENDE
ncbi:6908_t:CDS:2 [Paraglomus occultum]|uniref:6908_t:CDS:1 n=1 Tax=Paraglomus occultum TaxID=144539 RepID=A0A9N8ZV97_9GLOM|nr:6908_t:CDS:2 [Paraglomus occultum]